MKSTLFFEIVFITIFLLNVNIGTKTFAQSTVSKLDCENEDNQGNYYLFQPGLYYIANQIRDNNNGNWAYPSLLNAYILEKKFNNIDTFKFNWHCDTILCKNYSKDNNGTFKRRCELVSSIDSVKVYSLEYDPFFTHGFYMDDRYKDTYMRAIRHWDEKMLEEIFLPDSCFFFPPEFLTISRLVIEDGKLIDVKSMRSRGVREPYCILPK
ncbi:MAG: hypothetical protein K2M68_08145 [Muribaculaceae bacterium]|nr:hypothetical protein [Muribaculaceae bacterium]